MTARRRLNPAVPREQPRVRTVVLVFGLLLVLAGRAFGYIPPTNSVHGNPGDVDYQIADGGPDSHGWFGKDPTTCNPSTQPGLEGFCNACPSNPQCVGFGDSRIRQDLLGVSIVWVGAQQYFEFHVRYEFPNLYCVYDGTPNRPPESYFAQQMWIAGNADGTNNLLGDIVFPRPWFERGFWKPRIPVDCTREFFYLAFRNCTSPTTFVNRVVGPFRLPPRRLINGVCRPIDPRECGVPGSPGTGVYGPVNVGSGDVHYAERLIRIAGAPGPGLDLALGYASSQANVGMFGTGWSSTLTQAMDAVVGTNGNLLHRRTPENFDEYYTFNLATSTFEASSPGELRGTITKESGDTIWALKDLNGTVTRFDVASGRWLSTTDRWGNATTANYSGLPGSFVISDPQSRTLTFTLTGGLITQVTDSDGNTWRFVYSGNYLFQIQDPLHLSGGYWRQYEYASIGGVSPNPLSAVKDEAAKILEAHSYDSLGRATTSYAEGNRSFGTLAYDTPAVGQTTVTTTIDAGPPVISQTSVFDVLYLAGRYLPTRVNGNCSACSGAGGDDQSFTYDSGNHVLTAKVGVGGEEVQTSYTYDSNGMILTRAEPGGRTTTYTYAVGTPSGFLSPWPTFVTSVTEFSVVKTSPQLNRTRSFAWSTSGACAGAPAETCLQETATGYLTPADPTPTSYLTTTRFDSKHRVTEVSGPEIVGGASANRKTTFSYFIDSSPVNKRSRLQLSSLYTSSSGHLDTQFDNYDVFGTAKKMIDPNLVQTDRTTDSKGRATSVTSLHVASDASEADDYTTIYEYDLRDRLTTVTLPRGNQMQYLYEDGTDRLTDTIRADSTAGHNQQERLHLTLNAVGGKTREDAQVCNTPAANCGAWTTKRFDTFSYDTRNRLISIVHPDSTHIDYTYDTRGNMKTVKDENHPSAANTTYEYDSRNRLTRVLQTLAGAAGSPVPCLASAGQIATCYTYDLHDNLKSLTDPNGNVTTYTYDDFGRVQTQVSPVSGSSSYSYDAAGNVTSSKDGNNVITSRTYDAANRILSSSAGTESPPVAWTYDDPVAKRYALGRVATMADPSGSSTYAYERRGLVRKEAKTIDLNTYTLSYGYDKNGNRTSLTYPSGRVVAHGFDFADRPLSASSGGVNYVSSATYQPFGPESITVYGNGTTRTMFYDQRYRPTELKLAGSSTIYDYFYREDGVGNIISICATAGVCSSPPPGAYDRVFGYDDLNRLTSAKSGSSLWGSTAGNGYAYDAMGNMTSWVLGSRNATFTYVQASGHQTAKLASVTENPSPGTRTVVVDLAGNETNLGSPPPPTPIFAYSPRNLLATSSNDGLSYSYDGRGLRVGATHTGVTLFPVSLALDPVSIRGGGTVTVTVRLNDTLAGTVALTSSDSVLAPMPVPPNLVVSGGQATFSFVAGTPAQDTKVVITATLNQVAVSATLTVTAAARLVGLSFSPRTVTGGSGTTGTVTLNGPAPTGGAPVTLLSSSPVVTFPAGSPVTILAGQSSRTFSVATGAVTSTLGVDVKATYSTVDQHASLVVVSYAVKGLQPDALRLASLGRPWDLRESGDRALTTSFAQDHALEADTVAPSGTVIGMEAAVAAAPPGPPKRHFIYSPEMNLLAESELAWPRDKAILYEYVWFNGHPVAQVDGGTVTHWTFTDHLGTPLIQTTASQTVWWRAEYEPYGKVFSLLSSDQHQPLRLPGQEAEQLNLGMNGATERFYNIFRWYRPAWGRYTQPDPLSRIAPAWLASSYSSQLYGYAENNPLLFRDPLGLVAWTCSYTYATTGYPLFGPGGGIIVADCTSECACGRSVTVGLSGVLVGGSAGPIPGGGYSSSTATLVDPFSCPDANSLAGPASLVSGGFAAPFAGYSWTRLGLGSASSRFRGGPAHGIDVGIDAYGGYVWTGSSSSKACCPTP